MRRVDRTRIRAGRFGGNQKATADLAAGINAKNLDQILNLYADNSVFMPPNAPLLRGRDPLKSFYTDLVSKVTDLRLEPADVAGHGPIAYESGTYSMNTGTTRDRGKFLFVLRNMGGNWRFEYIQLEQRPSPPGGELGHSSQPPARQPDSPCPSA